MYMYIDMDTYIDIYVYIERERGVQPRPLASRVGALLFRVTLNYAGAKLNTHTHTCIDGFV